MELPPTLEQRAGLSSSQIATWSQELVVRGHDDYEGERHHHADEQSCNKPSSACTHEPRHGTAGNTEQRQRYLHPSGTFVARSPLHCGGARIEPHSRRVLYA